MLNDKLHYGTIRHFAHSNEWGGANAKKMSETAPSPVGTWTPSNTAMPRPLYSPPQSPNDSSITVRISTQKGPIGYNGTPQIHPQNYPFSFDDQHPHLTHPSLD